MLPFLSLIVMFCLKSSWVNPWLVPLLFSSISSSLLSMFTTYNFYVHNIQHSSFKCVLFKNNFEWKCLFRSQNNRISCFLHASYCLNICETVNKIKLFLFKSCFGRYSNNRWLRQKPNLFIIFLKSLQEIHSRITLI